MPETTLSQIWHMPVKTCRLVETRRTILRFVETRRHILGQASKMAYRLAPGPFKNMVLGLIWILMAPNLDPRASPGSFFFEPDLLAGTNSSQDGKDDPKY
ncbi:MAG: hypothetical protein VXW26_17005 [SAR324 cluster bacterium]|nr:hypothetical protein [SAR324 cluster bacterium]